MPDNDKIVFYYAPHTRASSVNWMIEETGAPVEHQLINFKQGDHKKPDYIAINPMGKVPAITHGGAIITEVAAICAYLADVFPKANLAPAIGDPRRGAYYRWMFFAPSCLEPAITDRSLKREPGNPGMLGYGDFDTVMKVTADALRGGPYLLGEQFTAADVVLGSTLRWTMMFKITPELPEFVAYVNRLNERPAWWIPDNPDGDFVAMGIYGQFIYVYPKYGVVIAKTSAYLDYIKSGNAMETEAVEAFRAIAKSLSGRNADAGQR